MDKSLIELVQKLTNAGKCDVSPLVLEDHITRMLLSEGNDKVPLERANLALERRKQTFSNDNPDLIRAPDLIAISLMTQSKHKEAEGQLRDAYEATERAHGESDLITISVLLSLGLAYTGQEKYERSA